MSRNLFKRIITSIILLFLLFFINFSHKYITILSILILGLIICIEANKIFSKLINRRDYNKKYSQKKFHLKFLILNVITFCYVFFIFFNFSYEIHKSEGAVFFLMRCTNSPALLLKGTSLVEALWLLCTAQWILPPYHFQKAFDL